MNLRIPSRKALASTMAAIAISLIAAAPVRSQPAHAQINLAVGSAITGFGPIWIALADNLFEKHKVKVDVVNYQAAPTGAAMLASGQIDVFATTPIAGIRIAQQGKPVSYLMSLANERSLMLSVVSKPTIKSIAQLQAMGSNCRMADLPIGTGVSAFNTGFVRAYKLGCNFGVVGTAPMLASGVATGQYDAAAVLPQDGSLLASQGKVNVLIDPAKLSPAEIQAIYPYRHPTIVVFGMQENLNAKRDGVVRFLAALREASVLLADMSPEEAARRSAVIKEAFGATPMTGLEEAWRLTLLGLPRGENAGFISETNWKDLVAAAPIYWNVNGLQGTPVAEYSKMVDMTYFAAALKGSAQALSR